MYPTLYHTTILGPNKRTIGRLLRRNPNRNLIRRVRALTTGCAASHCFKTGVVYVNADTVPVKPAAQMEQKPVEQVIPFPGAALSERIERYAAQREGYVTRYTNLYRRFHYGSI